MGRGWGGEGGGGLGESPHLLLLIWTPHHKTNNVLSSGWGGDGRGGGGVGRISTSSAVDKDS